MCVCRDHLVPLDILVQVGLQVIKEILVFRVSKEIKDQKDLLLAS